MSVVALVGCGAASPARPPQLGAGYLQNTLRPGGCSGGTCPENDTEIHEGQGAQIEALFPHEHVTPRVSFALARAKIVQPFAPTERGSYASGKVDWLFGAPSSEPFSIRAGLGFGIDMLRGSSFANVGPDIHGIVAAEYRWSEWSVAAEVTLEVMVLAGDGLSSDGTGIAGIPAFIGVRRDLQ